MSQQEFLPNQHKLFRAAFEALGYTPIKNIKAYSKGSSWYLYQSNSNEVSNFAYLDYKPRSKSFSIYVGATNSHEQEVLRRNVHTIHKFIHPAFLNRFFCLETRPVWTLFNCAHAMKWQSLRIPDPLARDTWPLMLDQLATEFLKPQIWPITTPEQVFSLYCRDDPPFEWSKSNYVLRLPQIVVLSKILGIDPKIVLNIFEREKKWIPRDMNKVYSPEDMLEAFFQIDVNL